jgi:thymidylate synthase
MYLMEPYDDALSEILKRGIKKADRTGVGCISVAGLQRKYQLHWRCDEGESDASYSCYFPLVTRRRLFPKSVFAELLWFLSGSTLNQDLEALGAKFWGKWCDETNARYRTLRDLWGYEPGDFGPIYGWQLRHFGADYVKYRQFKNLEAEIRGCMDRGVPHETPTGDIGPDGSPVYDEWYVVEDDVFHYSQKAEGVRAKGFDQLKFMIDTLKQDPFGSDGRRCMFSLWNPSDLTKMALPPCHFSFQLVPDGEGGLTGILTQRSNDVMVGNPANIQFYGALTIMLAQQAGMQPRELIHNMNDAHVYLDQIPMVEEYLSRPKPDSPKLRVQKAPDIYSYSMSDFQVTDYLPLDKMDVPVAV